MNVRGTRVEGKPNRIRLWPTRNGGGSRNGWVLEIDCVKTCQWIKYSRMKEKEQSGKLILLP